MKNKGFRIVNWGVWAPAAGLMRQLRFPGKMALISVAFLLPLAWLLMGFLAGEREDLEFVAQERQGVAYNQAVYRLLDASDQWRYAARTQAYGDAGVDVAAARQAFDERMASLRQLSQPHNAPWALDPLWTRIDQDLAAVQNVSKANPADIYGAMTGLSRSISALLAQVTDRSGLALDPEMSSYYLMSATLMRGPDIIRGTSELRGLAGGALRAGRIEPEQAVRMAELRSIVAHEMGKARDDLGKVQGAEPVLAQDLVLEAPGATAAFIQSLDRLFPSGATTVQGDAKALIDQANQTLATQYRQVDANLGVLEQLLGQRANRLQTQLWINLSVTAIGLLLAVFLAMGFYRSMFGGFKALRRHLLAISMGDLRANINGKGHDEVSDLLREVGYMQASLRETVQQVQGASDSVVQASMEIAAGTRDLASRTEAAAAALEESSAALEETTSSVEHTAESARQASHIAVDNAQVAERGGAVMTQVVETMERIQSSSRKINDIIGVIDGIAFQTNILALNAAVEAARAGEQGRGFAVVAGEVRSLAQRSAQAAKEIKALISSSVDDVSSGMTVVRSAGETMHEIVTHADQVRQLLDEVANGTREQSMGIGQIGQAVQDLDRNTQANATLVDQTAVAAASQRTAAVRMAAQVDEFRLPGAGTGTKALVEGVDVDVFIDAHRQWKVKLRDAIESRDKVDVAALSRDDCCALGKWIYGDGQRLSARSGFVDLIERHKHFHRVAGGVAEMVNQRHYRQAEDALAPGTPFSQATSEVVLALSSAKRLGF
ncbi:MAG: CZB domain-containing protein [Hydrogenophaga sp.]|uniref:methyl-accepting chemotaxis protein n=1 Tax=Hydrogenophaga sp. TaxID=1904254 RepID=UPI0025C56892|nr:methyl-accepting chemotaxis protein [Hydrogenophaga sp.]MBT9550987.1 CZB domain-containing protein [Hydrogenophaga sp.]